MGLSTSKREYVLLTSSLIANLVAEKEDAGPEVTSVEVQDDVGDSSGFGLR